MSTGAASDVEVLLEYLADVRAHRRRHRAPAKATRRRRIVAPMRAGHAPLCPWSARVKATSDDLLVWVAPTAREREGRIRRCGCGAVETFRDGVWHRVLGGEGS